MDIGGGGINVSEMRGNCRIIIIEEFETGIEDMTRVGWNKFIYEDEGRFQNRNKKNSSEERWKEIIDKDK